MRHLFVCTNAIGSGKPACGNRGAAELMRAVQQRLLERGVAGMVTSCACLGPCFDGPNAVVYPDGVWYGQLAVGDADALVDHLADGTVHGAKQTSPPG